ncbi:Unknown protein sequence [Pseudomonas syringae pv. cilantro]|uniref:Uncharacterized protein n=1 Tax=Pseudomonas syringae pv. cilantro TaxID=81035 RepID=A0A0N0XA34_PSESX|nr:Unknown protein sequence [Pseudomonas syringae pv. cilantro]
MKVLQDRWKLRKHLTSPPYPETQKESSSKDPERGPKGYWRRQNCMNQLRRNGLVPTDPSRGTA